MPSRVVDYSDRNNYVRQESEINHNQNPDLSVRQSWWYSLGHRQSAIVSQKDYDLWYGRIS